MTKRQRFINNKIRENIGTYLKYFDSNPSKALKKFGQVYDLENKLINRFSKEFTVKMKKKRYNRTSRHNSKIYWID